LAACFFAGVLLVFAGFFCAMNQTLVQEATPVAEVALALTYGNRSI
jgi:hypothetical protein